MFNNSSPILKRYFSSTLKTFREWKLIESRRVAKKPEYEAGDVKPLYVPKRRKTVPDYKYGEANVFKQSNKGLYGGSFIQFGNNISESKVKTRRTWLPNIIKKGLWSETLNKPISLKMTAKVLKTITKEGGIDNYLLKEKSARIKELGPTGWKLRYTLLKEQERKQNPPHKDAEIVETENGETKKIYYTVQVDGKDLNITVGRRNLLKLLFVHEKLDKKCDGLIYTHKKFIEDTRESSIVDIVTKLFNHGHDLSTITV